MTRPTGQESADKAKLIWGKGYFHKKYHRVGMIFQTYPIGQKGWVR
jgi:hypothetical protein